MAYLGRRGATAALTTGDIPDNSITAAKIVVDTITAGDLAPNSVDSSELVDGSVDLSHMSANSVDSNQYVDGSIDTIHIDNDQVTADKLANSINTDIATGVAALPKSGGTMSGNIVMGDDTSIGIADDAERIEFDGAGDISVLGAKFGIGTASPYGALDIQCSDRCQIVSSGPTNDAALWVTNSGQETGGSSLQVYTNSAHTGTRNVCKITNDHASATGTTALYVQQDSTGPAAYFGGNVGIGTAAPVAKLDILSNGSATQSSISAVAANGAYMINGAYTANQYYPMIGVRMNDNNSSVVNAGMYAQFTNSGSNLILGTSNSYSSGIDSSLFIRYDGNVGIGTAAPSFKFHAGAAVTGSHVARFENWTSNNPWGIQVYHSDLDPDNNTARYFQAQGTGALRMIVYSDGDIQNHDNAYGAISDERIKTNIKDANSQWDDIKAIKVRNFTRKDDVVQYGEDAWEQIGVVAQEVELVSPKLIKENPPSEWEMEHLEFGEQVDGKWVPKQVDGKDMTVKSMNYSILYMKAIKALQEAMTKIETLETKVTALENA